MQTVAIATWCHKVCKMARCNRMIESKDFTRDVIFANRAALAVRLGIFFTKECDIRARSLQN